MNVLTKVKEQVLKFYKSLYVNSNIENFELCPYTSLIVIDGVNRFLVSVDYIEKLVPCAPSMFDLRLIITCDGKIINQLKHTDTMFNLFKYVSNIHLMLSSKLEGLNNEVRGYSSIGNSR